MKNLIRYEGDTVFMDVGHGYEAMLDMWDLPLVERVKWSTFHSKRSRDHVRYVHGRVTVEGQPKTVYMHRMIMGVEKGLTVDHINNDPLDNRRSNLRIATQTENKQHRDGANRNSKSGVRGVIAENVCGHMQWRAAVKVNHKMIRRRFPYTPEGLELAKQCVLDMRRQFFPFCKEKDEVA